MFSQFSSSLLVGPAFLASVLTAAAAPVTKSGSGTDLNDGASWGGTAPGATDTATWDPASLGTGLTLGSNTTWDGIDVNGALSDIDISGAGDLTLGSGGIDAAGSGTSLSIDNNIVLGGNQTWNVGGDLTSTGVISGSGTLTLDGEIGTVLTHSSYLTSTPQTIFTAAQLGGQSLSDLSVVTGTMNGAWLAGGPFAPNGTYFLANDGTNATYQLQLLDDGFTKVTAVQFTEVGGDIQAFQRYAKFKGGSHLGSDFDAAIQDGLPPIGSGGYGVQTTTATFGNNTTITLSGNNTHTGGTVINGGNVLGGTGVAAGGGTQGGSFGTGDITINSGAVLKTTGFRVLGGGDQTTRSVNINGGTANIEGSGTGGEYLRTLNMTGGTLTADSANVYYRTPKTGADVNTLASADPSTISSGIDLTYTNMTVNTADGGADDDLVISGTITQNTGAGSGAKSIIKNGPGTLALSGNNNPGGAVTGFAGGVTINEGTVMARSNNALGTGAVTLGETANDVALYLGNRADVSNAVNVSASGTGQVTIGADNSGGGANAASFTGVITLNRPTTFSGEVSGDRLAIDGQITGNVGTLTVTGGSRTTLRSTANDFTGDLVISGAGTILQASVASAGEVIPDTADVTVATGAILQFAPTGNGTETIDALNGDGTVRAFVGGNFPAVLAVGADDGTGDFSGSLENGAGALSLTKLGAGVQTLSGASTHTGPTLVSTGTLFLNGSLGDTATTVEAGATIGGTGSLDGSLSFADGALLHVLDLGNALLVNGNVTFADFGFDALIGFDVASVDEGVYTLIDGANVDLTNVANVGAENAFDLGGGKFAYFQEGSLQVVVIPEPAVGILGALGLLTLFARRGRQA